MRHAITCLQHLGDLTGARVLKYVRSNGNHQCHLWTRYGIWIHRPHHLDNHGGSLRHFIHASHMVRPHEMGAL
jgi:hypothetical protein